MKKFLIAIFLIVTNQAYSQKVLFDTLKVDSSTKIIGRYEHHDLKKTYEKFNFIIEDPSSISQFIKNLKLGEEVNNSFENPNFKLTVVKNFKEIGSWTINPNQKSAMTHDGHTYAFDLNQINQLSKTYPFHYEYHKKTFATKNEYDTYLKEQKNNPNFLFVYGPQFAFEGSFEIEFKKTEQFANPKAIHYYLTPYIEEIVPKGTFRIGYVANKKNVQNPEQYTMTIYGPKKIFDNLKLKNLKNENWQPTVENGIFFYKKSK